MGDTAKIFGAIAVAITLFAGGIAISVGVWNECRADGHSFFYCMRLVSK